MGVWGGPAGVVRGCAGGMELGGAGGVVGGEEGGVAVWGGSGAGCAGGHARARSGRATVLLGFDTIPFLETGVPCTTKVVFFELSATEKAKKRQISQYPAKGTQTYSNFD